MKKIVGIAVMALLGFGNVNAQDGSLSKGSWVVEANTGSLATGNTAFSLVSNDGNTLWAVGAEAGYFIQDNLAIKAGLGYTDLGTTGSDGIFVYKVGAKYYLNTKIPVGVDFTGSSVNDVNANWVGLQAGYAWFVASNVSIEPTLRYNLSLDTNKAESAFQALVGFAFHF